MKKLFLAIFLGSLASAVSAHAIDLNKVDARCSASQQGKCWVKGDVLNRGTNAYFVYVYDNGADTAHVEYRTAKIVTETGLPVWVSKDFDGYSWDSGSSIQIKKLTMLQGKFVVDYVFKNDDGDTWDKEAIFDPETGAQL